MQPVRNSHLRVATRDDAQRLVADVLKALADLEEVLAQETALVRVGRLREGLAQEGRKAELASAYMRGLEGVKGNAVALARFAPDALDDLKSAHARFGAVVQVNQTVLATARAVSESLVKGIAEELGRAARPQVYAPAGRPAGRSHAPSEPLVMSKNL